MDAYCKEICKLEAHFYGLEFHHVLENYNVAADVLSKLGSKQALIPAGIFVQALNSPTVKIEEEPPTNPDLVPALGQEVLVADPDWRAPILDFIINNKSYPKDKEHERLAHQAASYVVIGTELFKHSASLGTLSKCISSARSTREFAKTTQELPPWWAKLSGQASIGRRPWPTAMADA